MTKNRGEDPAKGESDVPVVEIWCGGLQWALRKGYRKTDTLQSVRDELELWRENLDELIRALGAKAKVGEALEQAAVDDEWEENQLSEPPDDEDE